MTDREIATMAFIFSLSTVWLLFNKDARTFGLPPWLALIACSVVTGAGVGIAYVLTKWIVGLCSI